MSSTLVSVVPDRLWEVDEGRQLLGVLSPMAVVVTTFVALRFGVRCHRRAGFGLDDWLVLASLVNIIRLLCVIYANIHSRMIGIGMEHIRDCRLLCQYRQRRKTSCGRRAYRSQPNDEG